MSPKFPGSGVRDHQARMEFDVTEFYWEGDTHHRDWFPAHYDAKYQVAKRLQPRHIIEIGVLGGYSAAALLVGSPEATYHGFDSQEFRRTPHPIYGGGACRKKACWGIHAYGQRLVERLGGTYHVQDTSKIRDLGVKGDFVHVDGGHRYTAAYRDLVLAKVALEGPGHILVDDYELEPVRKAVRDFCAFFVQESEPIPVPGTPRHLALIEVK